MVLTVTEDTPADMLAGSMELLVQLPKDHNVHTQRVTVPRSTPMMDLLVQIATAHKLAASSYTLQAIGERGLVLHHQPNTPIGALDALQVKLLPKQGTLLPRKAKQANQPFETTFRLQVLLPRNQLYVSRVSPKMNLGKILDEVCREKNLDKNKYELRHPANLEETLDLSLSLQDYHLQEVTLYAKQGRTLGAALSSQDIMALQRQEERRRQQAKQSVFGFMFRKSKESSLSIDSLGGRSVSPARSDETGRSVSPLAPPARPQRKRRPAPKPPVQITVPTGDDNADETRDKIIISHSRNSSDSSGYHEASVLSDNPDSGARMPETLPRRSKAPCKLETSRKLAQTSESSKSLGNLAMASGGLSHGISSTSISSTGIRKKRAAPPPPIARPLSSAISTQALERIVDSEESLTSDIDISKSPSDIATSSKANSDIGVNSKANSDIGVQTFGSKQSSEIGYKIDSEFRAALAGHEDKSFDTERRTAPEPPPARLKPSLELPIIDLSSADRDIASLVEEPKNVENARLVKKEAVPPIPKPRSIGSTLGACEKPLPVAPRRRILETAVSEAATFFLPISIDPPTDDDERNDTPMRNDVEPSETIPALSKSQSDAERVRKIPERSSRTRNDAESIVKSRALKHAKSLNDICVVSTNLNDDKTAKEDDSSSKIGSLTCAVISTIPKCAYLTPIMSGARSIGNDAMIDTATNAREKPADATRSSTVPKRGKIFRSQSATNDFDVNTFERHARHLTSHAEDFTCAMNPNFSRSVMNLEIDETIETNDATETRQTDEESDDTPRNSIEEYYPAFVTASANLACNENSKIAKIEDNWAPQLIEHSASGDRPTETDILLQKVSDTLSSTLPLDESSVPVSSTMLSEIEDIVDVPRDQLDKHTPVLPIADGALVCIAGTSENRTKIIELSQPSERTDRMNRESLLSERNLVDASTPNATINSQQDTSDYVSATGDDLSITDWEYQLPAPPSAFRDNVSSEFDGYDTITLRSVEAFKEGVASVDDARETEKIGVGTPIRESPMTGLTTNEIADVAKPSVVRNPEIARSNETARTARSVKPKIGNQTSDDAQSIEASSELKKDVISELATKIENGGLPQSNSGGRSVEQDSRRSSNDRAAPKIAPVDNTLSNFTITTYSRQKSLNIFEEEPVEPRRSVQETKNTDDSVERTFATLNRNKLAAKNYNGIIGSTEASSKMENGRSSAEKHESVTRAHSVEHIAAKEMEFKKFVPKTLYDRNDALPRRPSLSNGHERSNIVHRSKSYITLANNSKYREYANGDRPYNGTRCENDDGRIVKSTSVTSLNREAPRQNEKFSQWRENILKRQEEPSKERQLQSLQVLKSILPQLKSTQQTEEDVLDSSNNKELVRDKRSETPSEDDRTESKSSGTEARTDEDVKSQKAAEETTTKRYKYAGPPAISLGSWSERPRVNVQLKMDTDYKFGTNNISGSKTVVNLNGTSVERNDEARSKDNSTKALPKNFAKNGTSMSNVVAAAAAAAAAEQNETLRLQRRESEDDLAKKLITHTTASGFKKPTLNRVGFTEVKSFPRIEDKPVVTSVALKKTQIERSDSQVDEQQQHRIDDERIDTKPVSFKELTKTFEQEVSRRTNPNRFPQHRHSDYYGARSGVSQNFPITGSDRADGTIENTKNFGATTGPRVPVKRYTSVVGIQSQSNGRRGPENGDTMMRSQNATLKINGPMPVVKGFKIQTIPNDARSNGVSTHETVKRCSNVPPPPPTMPIITGVTLKNSTARPKSMPICNVDPRDQLLESIRSFGGRDKLKNINAFG